MDSIFTKYTELPKQKYKFTKDALTASIPVNCLEKENIELSKNSVEWRWRMMKIDNKEFVEISHKKPNSARLYINKFSDWVERDIDPEFDKYVFKTYYSYSS